MAVTRHGRSRSGHLVAAVPLLALLVLAAACGARWSDEERAAVHASRNAGRGDQAASAETGGSSPTVAGADGLAVGADATSVGGAAPSAAGTTGGGASTAGPAGPKPCAAPSTAPGVTADSVTVGAIATVSGPVPGLAEGSLAAARAHVAYRNSVGGVCGRKIVLKTGDDGFENARFRSIVTDMSKSTLGLINTFAGGDGGGVDVATAANLPVTAAAMTDQWQDAPTVVDVNPLPKDPHASIGKYQYAYAHGVRTAAVATIAQAQSLAQMNLQQWQMEAAGIKIVSRQELPLSTLSFDAAARAVANSKADYFLFLAAGSLNTSMARSLHDSGYKPKFTDILTAYGSNFIEGAGDAAEGVTSWARALPFEERATNKELDTFLTWMARTAPGTPPDPFAVDAWASSKAFFDSLEALPGPISRAALLTQLKSVTEYDADGFYGRINLGQKISNSCYVAMQVVSGKWKRLTPAQGFLC